MTRLVIALAVIGIAIVIAVIVQRRRAFDPPTQPRQWSVPLQLDRDDFPHVDKPWLVAVFTSATCESCARATAKARVLESGEVGYVEVPYQQRKDLHERYGIDVVPCILMAGVDGTVSASFVGVPTATDLWAAAAEARQPGVSPEPDLGRPEAP